MEITSNLLHNQNYIFWSLEKKVIYKEYTYIGVILPLKEWFWCVIKSKPYFDMSKSFNYVNVLKIDPDKGFPILVNILYLFLLLIFVWVVLMFCYNALPQIDWTYFGGFVYVMGVLFRRQILWYHVRKEKVRSRVRGWRTEKLESLYPVLRKNDLKDL